MVCFIFCLTTKCCSTHLSSLSPIGCSCMVSHPNHLEEPAGHQQLMVGSFSNSPCATIHPHPISSFSKGSILSQTENLSHIYLPLSCHFPQGLCPRLIATHLQMRASLSLSLVRYPCAFLPVQICGFA
jgi:hypothetical protein